MRRVDATAYLSPYPARRVRRPVRIRLTEDTYPLEPSPEQSWLPIAFRAFATLARRTRVADVLIVGTGNGLDALGAAEIFGDLRSLTATDLYPDCVRVARDNVIAHLDPEHRIDLRFHACHLFDGLPQERRFDLVYENLPNLPAPADIELRRGALGGRFFDATDVDVPAPFGAYQLALHHRCLREARARVRAGGGVLTALGGRMPLEVAFDLHRTCGYTPELVAFDMKLQVEPTLVVPPYARAETTHGVRFRYYAREAVALVREARAAGLDGQRLADALERDLEPLVISAREAAVRVDRGEPVAHSVLMVHGRRA